MNAFSDFAVLVFMVGGGGGDVDDDVDMVIEKKTATIETLPKKICLSNFQDLANY